MKQKIGELNGKLVIVTSIPDEVTYNEILCENTEDGMVLKQRNSNGEFEEITKYSAPTVAAPEGFNKVDIDINSTIVGPTKWIKENNYIFYINKNDKFKIIDTNTGDDKTSVATLIATGKVNKVYEINGTECSDITIKEV